MDSCSELCVGMCWEKCAVTRVISVGLSIHARVRRRTRGLGVPGRARAQYGMQSLHLYSQRARQ